MYAKARILGVLALAMMLSVGTAAAQETLQVWTIAQAGIPQWAEAVAAGFTANNSGVKVEISSGWIDNLKVMTAGGVYPDVILYAGDYIPDMVVNGLLRPLDDFFARDFTMDGYVPVFDSLRVRGQLYGLPWSWSPYGFMYNATNFDYFGLSYPNANWTWDDMLTAAKKTTIQNPGEAAPSKWGLGMLWDGNKYFMPFVWGAGGTVWNDDYTVPLTNTPEVELGLQFYYDLFQTHRVNPMPQNMTNGQVQNYALFDGRISMRLGSRTPSVPDYGMRIGVTELPKGPAGTYATTLIVSNISMHANTDQPELAWKFMKYAVSEEGNRKGYVASPSGMQLSPVIRLALEQMQNDVFLDKENWLALAPYARMTDHRHPVLGESPLISLQRAVDEGVPIRNLLESREAEIKQMLADAIAAGQRW